MEEAAVHLVQRLLPLRETRVLGRRRAERRICGVGFRWCAALRLRTWCTNPRKTLFFRFLCTKSLALFGASIPWTWCTNPRKTLFLRFPCTKSLSLFGASTPWTWCKDSRKTLFLRFLCTKSLVLFAGLWRRSWCTETRKVLIFRFPCTKSLESNSPSTM